MKSLRRIVRLRKLPERRRGSTLIVVLALLGALLIMGLLVLTVASQEEVNAEYFADAAKVPQADLGPDIYFDWALRQVIIGPDPKWEKQSILWGGRGSMLPNMFGRTMQPFSGGGINLMWDNATSVCAVDMDGNLVPDNAGLLEVDSPAAQGQVNDLQAYPNPNPDYTAPDINCPFVSYWDRNAPATGMVLLPSYHRPQYLRGLRDSGGTPIPANEWYTRTETKNRVWRLHQEHVAIDLDGNLTTTKRAVTSAAEATTLGMANPFPSTVVDEGIWIGNVNNYELDAAPDGGAIKDAVWMDLGFPAQAVGPGEWYVPLFAIKVVELDSLFNVNTHGSLAGAMGTLGGPRFGGYKYNLVDGYPGNANVDDDGNGVVDDESEVGMGNDTVASTEFIHRSHLGAAPFEVNPQWGLHAAVGTPTGLTQLRIFFGHDPADAIEQANMEFLFLLFGRADFNTTRSSSDISALYAGRWGEISLLKSGIDSMVPYQFPRPGQSFPANPFSFNPSNPAHLAYDDNSNAREGGAFADPQSRVFPAGVSFPAQVHPTDYHGGQRTVQTGSYGRTRLLSTSNNHQHKWPRYDLGLIAPGTGYITLNSIHGSSLLPGASAGFQVDEPTETLIDPALAQSDPYDAIFGADETAGLHTGNNDKSSLNLTNRLDQLLPINFKEAANAETLRRLFTTVSWDLKMSGKAYYGTFTGTGDKYRKWEYQLDPTFGRVLFPPVYNTSNPPFRQEVRDLLTYDPNDPNGLKKPQGRLSINHILDRGFDGRLRFRPLTPHPTGLSNTAVGSASSRPTRPEQITSAADQEWMARRDRQLLCRDIYVLLYTLGGGNDAVNYGTGTPYSSDPNDALGRGDQCARMAQFAANLVDQMDPDSVMTVFEYDTNLSDGWGLDDNPFDSSGDAAQTSGQRAVVYGIEEQQLTLNESLVIWANQVKSTGVPQNHDATEWDDTNAHNWLMTEIENVSPRSVDLSTQAWQLAVKPVLLGVYATDPDTGGPLTALNGADGTPLTAEERRVTFQSGTVNSGQNSMMTVFTDNEADLEGTVVRQSRFVVNPHKGHSDVAIDTGDKYCLAPRVLMGKSTDPRSIAAQGLELDLMKTFGQYRINGGTSGDGDGNAINGSSNDPPGKDLLHIVSSGGAQDAIDATTANSIQVVIELRRRVNPTRQSPDPDPATSPNHVVQSRDNPWVVVDRIRVPLRAFAIAGTDNYTQIRPQLQAMTSRERREPLNRGNENVFALNAALSTGADDWMAYVWNSLGVRNLNGAATPPTAFNMWQPHYDRDFQTLVELFEVPAYGPLDLTKLSVYNSSNTEATAPNWTGNLTAGFLFLHPRSAAGAADNDNRWYRILEFLGVPDRWHRHNNTPPFVIDAGGVNANPIGMYRVPGKMNLNMMRSAEHLAGLIDDREICELNPGGNPWLMDAVEGTNRDWWVQFLLARDGFDPRGTGFILPGLPPYYGEDTNQNGILDGGEDSGTPNGVLDPRPRRGARPFRTAQYSASGVGSIEDTIFRSLPIDQANGQTSPRQLFEVGTHTEHTNGSVDPSVRHRILGKIANNTTVRSNAFVVYLQVDFFEAKEVTVGSSKVYRIGGKRADSPTHRGIFVVDRSKAFDLLGQQHLPTNWDDNGTPKFNFSFDQSFNFRSLILHRQTIR